MIYLPSVYKEKKEFSLLRELMRELIASLVITQKKKEITVDYKDSLGASQLWEKSFKSCLDRVENFDT